MEIKLLLKASAYFCLLTGIFNLITWIFLISTGGVPNLDEELISYLFHWTAEFTTAVLLITSGIRILKYGESAMNLLFLSLGLLLMAIGSAFVYYLLNFEPLIFIISTIITGITIILLITHYRSTKDFIFLTLGIVIYTLLNILGNEIQEKNIAMISLALPALVFILILTISLLNKEIVFKYQKSSTRKFGDNSKKNN